MLTLTEKAQQTVSQFVAQSEPPAEGLRISVSGGGCSGMQYGLALEPSANPDDTVVEFEEFKVFIDPQSAPMLEGITIDFHEGIEGSGFKFENPNAAASCGCGNSFAA